MDVTPFYYFDKWRGEICTTVNGKKAFRPGVGWKWMHRVGFIFLCSTLQKGSKL
jgi:hypothetical protein